MLLGCLSVPAPAAAAKEPWSQMSLVIMSDSATVVLRDPQHRLAWAGDTASFIEIPACSTSARPLDAARFLGMTTALSFEIGSATQGEWTLTARVNRTAARERSANVIVEVMVRAGQRDHGHKTGYGVLGSDQDSLSWKLVLGPSGKHKDVQGLALEPIGQGPEVIRGHR